MLDRRCHDVSWTLSHPNGPKESLVVCLGTARGKSDFGTRRSDQSCNAIARSVEHAARPPSFGVQRARVEAAIVQRCAHRISDLVTQRSRRRIVEINSLRIHRSLTVCGSIIWLCEAPTHTPRSSNGKLAVRESLGPPFFVVKSRSHFRFGSPLSGTIITTV